MKILVVSQYYKPEPFRISDICEALVQQGHEVTVLTGIPNYPKGEVYSGYDNGNRRSETINGVRVLRCWLIPRHTGAMYRLLNYHSFAISSSLSVLLGRVKTESGQPFDVVFVNQTSPVMQAEAAIHYGKKYQVPVVHYCLDLWPESLQVGGISKESLIFKVYKWISKRIYSKVSHILVTSQSFVEYLTQELDIHRPMTYFPQYAEELFQELPQSTQKDNDRIDIVFAGNIGTAQGLDTVIEAAKRLQDSHHQTIQIHIVGDGIERSRLQTIAEAYQLSNVHFYGQRPLEEMPKFYAMVDAMLVTLSDLPGINRTLPGKVQTYLAAGKPIIASINGECARLIENEQCGLVSPAEDVDGLVRSLQSFAALSHFERETMGSHSRACYNEQFTKAMFIERLEKILENQEV